MSDAETKEASAETRLAKLKATLSTLKDFSRAFLEQIAIVEADIKKTEREVAHASKLNDPRKCWEKDGEEEFHLSPSLFPDKCAASPEIALWSRSDDLLDEYQANARAIHTGVYNDDAIRRMASMRRAYMQTYELRFDEQYDFPPGALGTKLHPQKRSRGCKGLRISKDKDVLEDEDVYTPTGVSRKLEDRPQDGRWYYPQESPLRNEYQTKEDLLAFPLREQDGCRRRHLEAVDGARRQARKLRLWFEIPGTSSSTAVEFVEAYESPIIGC